MKYVLLTAAVLAFFAFGYFLMDRIDRFLCENQKAIQNEESDSKSTQILLSSDLTDDEILKEIHGFKKKITARPGYCFMIRKYEYFLLTYVDF
ncbi:MAG: hypothetical protein L6V93_23225 [Clostridiales bacterium]|nr:MAG: hypothetical protein L6V93_23225 [Clostridiales bacterium]